MLQLTFNISYFSTGLRVVWFLSVFFLAGWCVGWLVGWLAGLLVGCLVVCLFGWLAGWPVFVVVGVWGFFLVGFWLFGGLLCFWLGIALSNNVFRLVWST